MTKIYKKISDLENCEIIKVFSHMTNKPHFHEDSLVLLLINSTVSDLAELILRFDY